ncbi:diguanylate cyclase [Duganella sp. FT92W]|uniref:diguanylate cyclase n=1 Tax=Pseudoduganella rivuli TaxID=2666085 RepID=A0A7X2IUS8_9BURK|nr:diguanylate cyclase [Pseudoduganella rivuli]MRV76506.1 diguanylate cyclase [Pseudoduganella rivuli]
MNAPDTCDTIPFLAEDTYAEPCGELAPWKILIVDDDPHVHAVTELILRHITFRNRPLRIYNAASAAEARGLLEQEPDVAFALIDVVMETADAGLELVRHIREVRQDRAIRLVLRTGQPGYAPEQDVVLAYEIDDYKSKTELTAQKLFTSVIACLRAYELIREIHALNADLEARVAMRTAELQKLAMLDPLTGAGNRRHLEERAVAEIADCQRTSRALGVIMFDIDHFKHINDTWGHAVGDIVLQKVVQTASAQLRATDFLARIGGEEFVILVPGDGLAGAAHIAERIRAALACSPICAQAVSVPVTSSFGVTLVSETSLDGALVRADEALYQAKHGGRNQVVTAAA